MDEITGEAGNDTIWGGPGADQISGGPGADVMYGDNGNDVVDALDNNGSDHLGGGKGSGDRCFADGDNVYPDCEETS